MYYTPEEYKAGMYATMMIPATGSYGNTAKMEYNAITGTYNVSYPITSGAFQYSYQITYKDGTDAKSIDDPVQPYGYPNWDNPNSDNPTSSNTSSIIYGHYDPEKQAGSPDIDYVLPVTGSTSTVEYKEYKGLMGDAEDIGVYLPSGYDARRAQPYKVLYVSHGGGGNETDWFAMGQVQNIMDNLNKDYVVVTMNNLPYFNESSDRRQNTEKAAKNVMENIIPFVEENYNVSSKPEDRAFTGLSYGSRTTFSVFFDYADQFAYFGGYSSIDDSIYDKIKDIGGWPTESTFYFTVGPCDTDDRQEAYATLQKYIKDNNIQNFIDGGKLPGSHDWLFWQQAFYTFVGGICWQDEDVTPGATVVADANSPTGYTVKFVYKPEANSKPIESVTVSGPFKYVDPSKDVKAEGNAYSPMSYKAGMFPTNHTPATGTWGASFRMNHSIANGVYTTSFPISSGSFAYSYNITYKDGTTETIADPTSPSPALANPDSNYTTGDAHSSIVYGKYDAAKQAGSPNLDFILPSDKPAEEKGRIEWATYSGSWTDWSGNAQSSDTLDLGIYLPAGYDADREEPYKVVYTSHGAGGNETDWFGMAHVDNMLDNLGLDYVVVTMDNSSASFNIDNVVKNIIPYVEEHYNVCDDASGRAFNGLSAGGQMTGRMFLEYPDEFAYFASYCGFNDIASLEAKAWPTEPIYYIATGNCDPLATRTATAAGTSSGFQYDTFKENLAAKGIGDNVVDGGKLPGSHDWFVWSQAFYTFVTGVCWQDTAAQEAGVTVEKDASSPTGYTVNFVYENKDADVTKVQINGEDFRYVDPSKDVREEGNGYTPAEYKAGMFASAITPGNPSISVRYDMKYNALTNMYSLSVPISSGSFRYQYVLTKADGTTETIDDPTNPSPAKQNDKTSRPSGDVTKSVVIGRYDATKQAGSPNFDSILIPDETKAKGTVEWIEYTGFSVDRDGNRNPIKGLDLGVYLPAGYDKNREEPYKVMYTSHGAGGNETDWIGMAHVPTIMDNLELDYVVVTIDNSSTGFNTTNVIESVIPTIESKYNVCKEPSGRAYNGLSAGGMMTGRMFNEYADQFAYFGAYNGFTNIADTFTAEKWPENVVAYYAVTGATDTLMTGSANGRYEEGSYERFIARANELGWIEDGHVIDGGLVPGAHDWFSWIRTFTTFAQSVCWQDEAEQEAGVSVVADENSPTGYTVNFVYENTDADVTNVQINGEDFRYVDPSKDVREEGNGYTPAEYKPGMYAAVSSPGKDISVRYDMKYNALTNMYSLSVPISSGSFRYQYVLTKADGTVQNVDDPTNPSPAKQNDKTSRPSGDVTKSVIVGHYDEVKQAGSPNFDDILTPVADASKKGTVEWIEYDGFSANRQTGERTPVKDLDLGIYLPAGYDPDRKVPYKVMYTSHGAGGNETDWIGMAHVPDIMDNLGLGYVVVTIDNSSTSFSEDNIIENVIPTIESKYNVRTDPAGRAYNGLSAGGMMTGRVFNKYADHFAYFGSYNGFTNIDASFKAEDWPENVVAYYAVSGTTDTLMTGSANGRYEEGSYERFIARANELGWIEAGHVVDGGLVPGGHDWFSWIRTFTTFASEICWQGDEPVVYEPGATVVEDAESPSGYTAHFVFDPELEKEDVANIASVSVSGLFNYIDPDTEVHDAGNLYTPYEYKAGMYPSNRVPSTNTWGLAIPMEYDEESGYYTVSFPITSGAFPYSYAIEYKDGEKKTIDDPANPSPCLDNEANSDFVSTSAPNSMVLGHYDPEKQAGSPNIDYVLPVEGSTSQVIYDSYKGSEGDAQDIGIYLPSGYDKNREEPYKVIYTSHGSGGNETDWMGMGQVKNIMDNIGEEYVVVTIDNSTYFNKRGTGDYDFRKCTEEATENLMTYLIPYVEGKYNVSSDPADRAFNGLSFGGRTTFTTFFDHSDEFAYFGAYSSIDDSTYKKLEEIGGWPTEGTVYFSVGPCDTEDRIEAYEKLQKYVADNNIENFIDGGLLPGSHDWIFWQQAFYTFVTQVCWADTEATPGASVEADENSPSGYTVKFAYEPTGDKEITGVTVSGPFNYMDKDGDVKDVNSVHTPYEYEAGMYLTNIVPSTRITASFPMKYSLMTGMYSVSFPITSGSFAYSYNITYADGTTEKIADPVYGPVTDANPKSDKVTSDATSSVVYGKYDPVKQAGSPNLDFVLPVEDESKKGTVNYYEYTGNVSDHQDLGIYLPAGYDENREEPYRVVYTSHGGGGNETDWFTLAHVDNIIDNLGLDYIVVTMDNSTVPAGTDNDQRLDNILDYVIPYMEANYNVSKDPQDRAFNGLSMGGGIAGSMLLNHGDQFGYIASYSGFPDITNVAVEDWPANCVYYIVSGTCDVLATWAATDAEEPRANQYEGIVTRLQAKGLDTNENIVIEPLLPGSHDWFIWSQGFYKFVKDICWAD